MVRVVIIGAGYAGVVCARRLSRLAPRDWDITVLDRNPYHQLLTRLPEVATGETPARRAAIPLREIIVRRVNVRTATVIDMDPDGKHLMTSSGDIETDLLVVATGSAPDYLDVEGAEQWAFVMRSVVNAVRFHDSLSQKLVHRATLRVVVVGAGYTGTEMAGALAQFARGLAAVGSKLSITLVAADFRLLPEGNLRLGEQAEAVLQRKGVTLRLGQAVVRVAETHVHLRGGEVIPADMVVWAAHSRSAIATTPDGWRIGTDNRLRVDPYLQLEHHNNVYVIGDAALSYDFVSGRYDPSTAQLALQEGALAASNILAQASGRSLREYRPHSIGEALSLGGQDGVADVLGVMVHGRGAVAAKRAVLVRYLARLGGIGLVRRYA